VQADWEAILRSSPAAFVARICDVWLLCPHVLEREDHGHQESHGEEEGRARTLEELPNVNRTITTLRQMLEALNIQEY
jgi:hypothetical protein